MHPEAFHVGSWAIHWYGILVATGFLVGLWTASRRGIREGLSPDRVLDLGPLLIIGAMVGARLLHIVTYWRELYAPAPWTELFALRTGFVFYGGLIGASLTGAFYLRWKKQPIWRFADALAPSIALGSAFGRLGCLMTGCCYGRVCSVPWAIHFPSEHETQGFPVHPTQIYDSLLNFALYAGTAWLYRRKKFDGQIFALFFIGYAIIRATVETFRGDYKPANLIGPFTPAQAMGIAILVVGVILYAVLRRAGQRPPSAP